MTGIARLLTNLIVNAQLARAAVERVYDVIDHPHDPGDTATGTLPDGPLGVELDGVGFAHHTHDAEHDPEADAVLGKGKRKALIGAAAEAYDALVDAKHFWL